MNSMQNIKSKIYWVEVAITFILLFLGIVLTVMLVTDSNNILESTIALAEFAFYLAHIAIRLLTEEPVILVMTVFWFFLYLGSLFYFAQTATEKKFLKIIIPVSLATVVFCSTGIFGFFLSKLASQGAGH